MRVAALYVDPEGPYNHNTLEHPEASHAFHWFGLPIPARDGGWTEPDRYGGRSCCVEQGHYGHQARKATWLYSTVRPFPSLRWGKAEGCTRMDEGFHSAAEREAARSEGQRPIERVPARLLHITPLPFAELLLQMALGLARSHT